MPRPSWLTIAMWAASAVGLSINMTSGSDPLPAGATVEIVWAQDNATANPSQFSLYIVPAGPQENVIDAQLVNAGSQLSGTVTMVLPPETSPGVYDALAYTGTDSPTVGTGPSLWANEFNIVAAVQSGGLSSFSGGLSTPLGGSSSSSGGSSTLSSSQPTTTSSKPSSFSSSPTDSSQPTFTAALNETGIPKHAISVGAIVGIVLGLIFAFAAIGLLLLYLRRRRQRARRYSAPEPNHPLPLEPPLPVITPFPSSLPPMTQVVPSIREKDGPIGSSKSASSPTVDSPGSSSRSTTSEHQEALARLEREVQLLRQQQNSTYGDEPPPEYNTL